MLELTFKPPRRSDAYIPIKEDQEGHQVIMGPHWSNDGQHIEIAGYASGRKISIDATIIHDCDKPFWIKPKVRTTTPRINGEISIEIDFPPQRFVPVQGSSNVIYSQDANDNLLGKTVDYFDKSFPIEWEFALDVNGQSGEYQSFKTTNHTLGVTRKFPVSLEDVYETTIYLGCLHAQGLSSNNEIVSAIWVPFDKDVFNVQRYRDSIKFTYWNNCEPESCLELSQMLAISEPDGRCQALRDLLAAVIYTQGIPILDPNVFIVANDMFINMPEMDLVNEFGVSGVNATWKELETVDKEGEIGSDNYMAVREWETFITSSSNNLFELNSPPENCPSNWVHWATGDPGLKGQGGVPDPLSLHLNHTWLKYKGTYYDPSYGVVLPNGNIEEYKSKYLDSEGGKIFEVTFNSGEVKYYYWIGKF